LRSRPSRCRQFRYRPFRPSRCRQSRSHPSRSRPSRCRRCHCWRRPIQPSRLRRRDRRSCLRHRRCPHFQKCRPPRHPSWNRRGRHRRRARPERRLRPYRRCSRWSDRRKQAESAASATRLGPPAMENLLWPRVCASTELYPLVFIVTLFYRDVCWRMFTPPSVIRTMARSRRRERRERRGPAGGPTSGPGGCRPGGSRRGGGPRTPRCPVFARA